MVNAMIGLNVFILIAIAVSAAEKPPVPIDVPFVYDPNLCQSPVMDFMVMEPNALLVYAIGVHNERGREINITIVGVNDTNVVFVGKVTDPNSGWNQYFQIEWQTPPDVESVYYLNIVATDTEGQSDERTLLIHAMFDDVPYIFPVRGPIPTALNYEAEKVTEYAQSIGSPVSWPHRIQLSRYPDMYKRIATEMQQNPTGAFERLIYAQKPYYKWWHNN